jgi:IS5 family transposase
MIGEIGVLIPIVALSIPIVSIWTKHRQRIAEMQIRSTAEVSAEKAAQYASHSRELEERVRVLERIVTDKGYDVAAQIEALRDARTVDDRMLGHAERDRVQ